MRPAIFSASITMLLAAILAATLAPASVTPQPVFVAVARREAPTPTQPPISPEPHISRPEPLPPPPTITEDDTDAVHTAQVERHQEPEPITIEITAEGDLQPVERTFEDTAMGDGNVEAWRPVVEGAFGDLGEGAVNTALCLMVHESGGNPDATNPSSGASGLMQVMPDWADHFGFARDDLYDPTTNLWISRQLYDDGGWGHWSPWNRGECH